MIVRIGALGGRLRPNFGRTPPRTSGPFVRPPLEGHHESWPPKGVPKSLSKSHAVGGSVVRSCFAKLALPCSTPLQRSSPQPAGTNSDAGMASYPAAISASAPAIPRSRHRHSRPSLLEALAASMHDAAPASGIGIGSRPHQPSASTGLFYRAPHRGAGPLARSPEQESSGILAGHGRPWRGLRRELVLPARRSRFWRSRAGLAELIETGSGPPTSMQTRKRAAETPMLIKI